MQKKLGNTLAIEIKFSLSFIVWMNDVKLKKIAYKRLELRPRQTGPCSWGNNVQLLVNEYIYQANKKYHVVSSPLLSLNLSWSI